MRGLPAPFYKSEQVCVAASVFWSSKSLLAKRVFFFSKLQEIFYYLYQCYSYTSMFSERIKNSEVRSIYNRIKIRNYLVDCEWLQNVRLRILGIMKNNGKSGLWDFTNVEQLQATKTMAKVQKRSVFFVNSFDRVVRIINSFSDAVQF